MYVVITDITSHNLGVIEVCTGWKLDISFSCSADDDVSKKNESCQARNP